MKRVANFFDYIALSIGILSILHLFLHDNSLSIFEEIFLLWLPASIGVIYLLYAIYLWFFKKAAFDWHLLHGNFLRKVICMVILVPFILMAIMNMFGVGADNLVSNETCAAKESSPLWTIFIHYIDPGLQLEAGPDSDSRTWSAIIAILGILLLNGLLVSSLIAWFDGRKEKYLKGETRYPSLLKMRSHYVIIGGNDMVEGIVKQLFDRHGPDTIPYILIQTSQDVESFRRRLFSSVNDKEKQQKIIIYYGNRDSVPDLKDLILKNAMELYLLGEETRNDDIESYHDTLNMKCLRLIKDNCCDDRAGKLVCRVMFEYQTTFSVFQFYDIDKKVAEKIDFRPFNYYEMWAQNVLINRELDAEKLKAGKYLPLEGAHGIRKDSDDHVHLFIVGMSRIGVAMGIEAAHLAHYPNYEEKKIRTKITFIDKNADEEKDFFMGRFKELFALSHWRYGNVDAGALEWEEHSPEGFDHLGGDFIDIELEFVNSGIETAAVQDYILESATENAKVTIAICLPESNRSHAAALYLSKEIYASDSVLQVLVYNRYSGSIVDAISGSGNIAPYCGKLRCFGQSSLYFLKNLTESETIGAEIDKAYDSVNIESGVTPLRASYKGKSSVANAWSSLYNGNTLWTKLRCVGSDGLELDEESISVLADVEHNRWNVEELLMNFKTVSPEQQKVSMEQNLRDKNILKSEMTHIDICSNKRLLEVDADARLYDVELTKSLLAIYKQLRAL